MKSSGADISERLVAVARQRTGAEGITNARFLVADVQTAVVDGDPSDVAISQFGVMFFDESVAGATTCTVVSVGIAGWHDPLGALAGDIRD